MKSFVRLVVAILLSVGVVEAADPEIGKSEPKGANRALVGTWILISRQELARDGTVRIEPSLGETPLGLLFYDVHGHMAVQLMRRDRSVSPASPTVSPAAPTNNSDTSSGYDAYFGTYTVDSSAGTVTHHLEGALSPADVGKSMTRHFKVSDSELTLWFEITAADGSSVTRRLVWRRVF
jgi:hypothetical protein